MIWIYTKDKPHPDADVQCLISRNGRDALLATWNAHESCWDDSEGDDFFCGPEEVVYWMEVLLPGAEKAYGDFRERVREEKRELDERMERLSAFLDTDMYRSLPDDEQERMGEQLALQQELSRVLGKRIANFKAD